MTNLAHPGVRMWLRRLRQRGVLAGDELLECMHGAGWRSAFGQDASDILELLERRGTIRRGEWRPHPQLLKGLAMRLRRDISDDGARTAVEPLCIALLGYLWHPRYRSIRRARKTPRVAVVRLQPATVEDHYLALAHHLCDGRPMWEQDELMRELRRVGLVHSPTSVLITELARRKEPQAQAAYADAIA